MGTLYSITVVIGLLFVGVAFLIFAVEGGKKEALANIGGALAFLAALTGLYFAVEAFLRP